MVALSATVVHAQTVADAPASFGVSGRTAILAVHALGVQIYECKPASGGSGLAWVFREPAAALFEDGQSMGRHYLGPHWALIDGSLIQGKFSMTAPGATSADVAWLKLDVAQNAGVGVLKDATTVLRLNTKGGALKGPCAKAGDLSQQLYESDYLFLR